MIVPGQDFLNYKIIKEIGEGGMGQVFLAEDTHLKRKVAIKTLKPNAGEKLKARFQNEARVLASLNHPNIVTIYNYGVENDFGFIVMEFIEGQSISEALKSRAFDVLEALKSFKELVDAVSVVHKAGVLHRDIKPSNVMLLNDGTIRLVDFGISKDLSEVDMNLTARDHFIGTIYYIAPEIVRGQRSTTQSDIYSLGVVLYEMLAGINPFASDDKFQILERKNAERLELPADIQELVPKTLIEILYKCTYSSPENRYSSAEELKKDLDTLHLEDLPEELFAARRLEVRIANESTLRMKLLSHGFKTREIGVILSLAAQIQEKNLDNPDKTAVVGPTDKVVISKEALRSAITSYRNSKAKLTQANSNPAFSETLKEEVLPAFQRLDWKYKAAGSALVVCLLILTTLPFLKSQPKKSDHQLISGSQFTVHQQLINLSNGQVEEDNYLTADVENVNRGVASLKFVYQEDGQVANSEVVSGNPFVKSLSFGPYKGYSEKTVLTGDYNSIFPLEVGKKMNYSYVTSPNGEKPYERKEECVVTDRKNIQVRSGDFDTFVVKCVDVSGKGPKETVYYYSEELRRAIKTEKRIEAGKGNWILTVDEVVDFRLPASI